MWDILEGLGLDGFYDGWPLCSCTALHCSVLFSNSDGERNWIGEIAYGHDGWSFLRFSLFCHLSRIFLHFSASTQRLLRYVFHHLTELSTCMD